MGLSVGYSCFVVRNVCLQHRVIAPLPMWSYVGLGLSRKCIIVVCIFVHSFVVMNIRMLIAPLPIWSYVGLGLGSRNVVMDMY